MLRAFAIKFLSSGLRARGCRNMGIWHEELGPKLKTPFDESYFKSTHPGMRPSTMEFVA